MKPAPRPPANPAPKGITAATLGATLKAEGFQAVQQAGFHVLTIEEEQYTYPLSFSTSPSGEWLICVAQLAEIDDLTTVKPGPLLALLSTNDRLLGMYFSYEQKSGRIVLNATLPIRAMDGLALSSLVAGIRRTVRETQGLWDTRKW